MMGRVKIVPLYSYTAAFVLIISMVTGSIIVHSNELILPEIAAMAIAMWAYRDPNWLRDPLKICLAPSMTSAIGFTMNQIHMDYLVKAAITLVLILICLRLIRSGFAPAIATGLLPLITNAQDVSLLLLIFIATFLLMAVVLVFGMHRHLERNMTSSYKSIIFFIVIIFLWFGVCWLMGFESIAVLPPVLVVAYEAIQKANYSGIVALKQGTALTISASAGAFLFLFIDSLIVTVLLDLSLMLLLQQWMKIRMPAIYAFPLFSFILPKEMVYHLPFGTLVTCFFMFVMVTGYKRYEKTARSKKTDVSV